MKAAAETEWKPGVAALEVHRVAGESAVTSAFASSPMKMLTPRARGQSVWACTSSFGGGLVAGDETTLNVRVGNGAHCFIGTQASTKIYRNPASLPCGHRTCATLGTDSLLVFAPDPVQAFADSHYAQRQRFELASGAGLVLIDWFTSGRAACGERWAFKTFQSRNEVLIEGRLAFLDSLLLSPEEGSLDQTHRMGRFNCFALLLLIGSGLREESRALLNRLAPHPVEKRAALIGSASPIREGSVFRIAGESVEAVRRELYHHMAFVSARLGDDPWARKGF
jgi:urease accessory protein